MSDTGLAARPFYAGRLDARGATAPWDLEDLEDFAATSGDPFAGRLLPGAPPPPLSLQLETCDDPPVWVGVDARELAAWSRALERVWRGYGLHPGECVALFDYGSSPLVLLASASYAPHARRGVAERLGVRVICNDGLASQAERMVEIFRRVRPAALVARRDVLAPLADALDRGGVEVSAACRWVLVSEPEGLPPVADVARYTELWGVPVRPTLRADAAFLITGQCAACGAFHLDRRLYRVEGMHAEGLAVTARFARRCPAVRYRLEGWRRRQEQCEAQPGTWSLQVA